MTKSLADTFKKDLQTPMKLIHIFTYLAIGVGSFLIVAVILVLIVKRLLAKVCPCLNEPGNSTTKEITDKKVFISFRSMSRVYNFSYCHLFIYMYVYLSIS